MGEVYLAIDQRLGHPVALKRTMFTDDEVMSGAFEREARTLARLRHPALPKVSDHFTENDNQYLVMEHIAGDDLAKRLSTIGKPFPMSWVLYWADQLLEALAYLHANEPPIIHRDIKPQNLKLTDENNIILLDFGLSKSGLAKPGDPTSGSSGSIVGYTPHFAPMEQIRGTGTNPKSDIYSLSATLYQLLTNICPPDALTRADAMLAGSPDPLQAISSVNAEVPKSVSDVIAKGMAVSQEHRHSSAREMQKYLRDAYSKAQSGGASEPEVGEKTVIMETKPAEPAPSEPEIGAATLIYDEPPFQSPEPSAPKQSEIKTEVFSAGSLDVPTAPNAAEPTAPAISFGQTSAPSGGGEIPTVASGAGVANVSESVPSAPAVQEKKSSKGLLLGLIFGIVVLGVLLVGVGGAAYYFLKSSTGTEKNAATPTPSPTAKPSPSPAPSVEAKPSPSAPAVEPSPEPTAAPTAPGPRTQPKPQPQPKPQTQPKPTSKPTRQIPM